MRIASVLQGLISSVPYFILSATFMKTWLDPSGEGARRWIGMALGLFLLEFLLMHSAGFLYAKTRGRPAQEKRRTFAFALGLYGLFAVSWAVNMRSWTLIAIYTWVMLSRWTGEFASEGDVSPEFLFRLRASAIFILLVVALAMVVPWPELGLTGAVRRQWFPGGTDSDVERYPHKVLAMAVLYFTLMGITELVIAVRNFDQPQEGQGAHS